MTKEKQNYRLTESNVRVMQNNGLSYKGVHFNLRSVKSFYFLFSCQIARFLIIRTTECGMRAIL